MGLKPETDGWLYRKRVTLQHAGIRSTVNWSCIYASEFRVESKASHWVPLEIEAETNLLTGQSYRITFIRGKSDPKTENSPEPDQVGLWSSLRAAHVTDRNSTEFRIKTVQSSIDEVFRFLISGLDFAFIGV